MLLTTTLIFIILNIIQYFFYSKLKADTLDSLDRYDESLEILDSLQEKLETAYVKLKELEASEAFEKDDEVGVAFRTIIESINELNQFAHSIIVENFEEEEYQDQE